MVRTMVLGFSVDLWFIFGSFVYAFEGQVLNFSESTLEVAVDSPDESGRESIIEFFEGIVTNPKGLERIELRIFSNESLPKPLPIPIAFPVQLITGVSPLTNQRLTKIPSLVFSQVKGITEADRASWINLVHKIWP